MMIDTRAVLALLAGLGALIGLVLSALHILPIWAIPLIAIATPLGVVAVLFLFAISAWMRDGCH